MPIPIIQPYKKGGKEKNSSYIWSSVGYKYYYSHMSGK